MSVIDETWKSDLDGYIVFDDDGECTTFSDGLSSRRRLAACAPEMARVLLHCMTPKFGGYCAICNGWMGDREGDEGDGHLDDCALVGVLRKAGVLE